MNSPKKKGKPGKRRQKKRARMSVFSLVLLALAGAGFLCCLSFIVKPRPGGERPVSEAAGKNPSPARETQPLQSAPQEPGPPEPRKNAPAPAAAPASAAASAAKPAAPEKKPALPARGAARPPALPALPGRDGIPPAVNNAKLVFVFDDAGQNLSQLAAFLRLPFPLTIAVLPALPHSAAAAAQSRRAGKEVILHQPMQARNLAVNPGPGAIGPGMSAPEAAALLRRNIAEIAPIAGVNNHEGSLVTESALLIGAVLDVCQKEGLYFLDSRTTAATAAPLAAAQRGFSIWERDVFLDNVNTRDAMRGELLRGLGIANRKGVAVMIGHVWSPLLAELLAELYPELAAKGYTFTTISAAWKPQ